MSNERKKRPRVPVPTGTGPVRRFFFTSSTPRDPSLPMTALELVDSPPAGASVDWLWAELPALRVWLTRQAAEPNLMPLDPDQMVRRVVDAVEAQRPELGAVSPQEYLRTLVGKLVALAD